ncbi:MAG: M28 family peptidase [Candidatus Lokiarchaeia archaeon]
MYEFDSELEKSILKEISGKEMMKNLKWLAEEVPERLAGSPEDRKTAEWIKSTLESYGVHVGMYEFDALLSFPLYAELKVLSPGPVQSIEAIAYAHSGSTLPEGISGELVYVGAGGEKDYENVDAEGKITLAEISYDPPRPYKIKIAQDHGVKAQVQMNWGSPEHDVLPMGTMKPVWGNPTPDTIDLMPTIPGIAITRKSGEWLKELLNKGKVRVWMRVEATREWIRIPMPIASVEGTEEPEKFVMMGGHMDAWGGGVTDNGTGIVCIMEMARILQKHRYKLKRSAKFGFWAAHESGIMEGSTWYTDNFWSDLNKNCIAYLNCDSTGMVGSKLYFPLYHEETERYLMNVIEEILGKDEVKAVMDTREFARSIGFDVGLRPSKVADNGSFFGLGIPVVDARTMFDVETLMKEQMAVLGWWYQSIEDTIDKTDPKMLEKAMKADSIYLLRLMNTPILPFEFFSLAGVLKNRLEKLNEEAKGRIELKPLIKTAEELEKRTKELDETIGKVWEKHQSENTKEGEELLKEINQAIIKLSRLLIPINYTYIGRYERDPYGATYVNRPIPVLLPILEYAKMDPESEEYKLLTTKIVQEKNKVSDTLDEALWQTNYILRKMKRYLK